MNANILKNKKCKDCGWPVIDACCNGSFQNFKDASRWDWWQHFIQNNIIKRKIFNKIIESKISKLEKATGKKFTSLRNNLLQFLMTNSSQILREINKILKKVNS